MEAKLKSEASESERNDEASREPKGGTKERERNEAS
jgi:hypothetical protein